MSLSTTAGLFFFAVGGATLVWAWISFHRAIVTMGWPSAPGVVVSSGVSDAGAPAVPVIRGRYAPRVTYRYDVDGDSYTSDIVCRAQYRSSFRASAERVASRYPAGSPVRVFHHPRDPRDAVLEPGTSPQNYRLFLIGALLLALGAAALSWLST